LVIGGGNAYKAFDLKNNIIKEATNDIKVDTGNLTSPSQQLDAFHIQNFFSGIKSGTALAADINGGHQSTLLCQLGNIAQRTGRTLNIDSKNGHILNDKDAMKLWSREYQKGWEPKV
jgi:hypothetical protein